jgi:hypothetical protein
MTVFVSVARMAIEDYWQPEVLGDAGLPLLEGCRKAEDQVWLLVDKILNLEQRTELRQAIEVWHQQNPIRGGALAAHALGFTSQVAEANRVDVRKPGSVFSLLGVDPLAGMDPAVRELAETRLFAERALFVAQRMPRIVRWQIELLSLNASELPAVSQLVTNSTRLAESVDRFATVSEQLPSRLSHEREEVFKALRSQTEEFEPLVHEVRLTLEAGSQMSDSLNATLTSFDALMKRFGVGEMAKAQRPATNTEPFRILDYAQTASQLESTAQELTKLVQSLDLLLGSSNWSALSAQVGPAVQQAQTGGKEIVDYAFGRSILLFAILCAMVAGTALLYRLATSRGRDRPVRSRGPMSS